MAHPKKKTSKARRDSRRSHHALTPVNVAACPQCKEPKRPHYACAKCGYYNGKEVISVTAE
jgi:large subunit ribosomal protein L32